MTLSSETARLRALHSGRGFILPNAWRWAAPTLLFAGLVLLG